MNKYTFVIFFLLYSCGKPSSWIGLDSQVKKVEKKIKDLYELTQTEKDKEKHIQVNNRDGREFFGIDDYKYEVDLKLLSKDLDILKVKNSDHKVTIQCLKNGDVKVDVEITVKKLEESFSTNVIDEKVAKGSYNHKCSEVPAL